MSFDDILIKLFGISPKPDDDIDLACPEEMSIAEGIIAEMESLAPKTISPLRSPPTHRRFNPPPPKPLIRAPGKLEVKSTDGNPFQMLPIEFIVSRHQSGEVSWNHHLKTLSTAQKTRKTTIDHSEYASYSPPPSPAPDTATPPPPNAPVDAAITAPALCTNQTSPATTTPPKPSERVPRKGRRGPGSKRKRANIYFSTHRHTF
ncbi:hypothetical protein U1Q18_047142 [Sarracenia purpurea var. burkii]